MTAERTKTGTRTSVLPALAALAKRTVVGAVERQGNVVARVIAHANTATLNAFVREAVSEKVSLIDDERKLPLTTLWTPFLTTAASIIPLGNTFAVHTATIDGV